MNDDLRRRLEEAGHAPAPGPRPGFADELEERLLSVARTTPAADPVPGDGFEPRPRSPRRRPTMSRGRGLAGGLVGLTAGLVVALVVGGISVRPMHAFELTDPVNVEVALSDGTTLVDPDGLLLPDGAVVRIGVGGSAMVGDVLLGAGDVATIDDRRLSVDRLAEATASGATIPSPLPTTKPPAVRTPTPARPATPRPVATPRPTATPRPDATPKPRPATPTPTPTPTRRPTDQPPADVKPLRLEARATDAGRIRMTWTGTPRAARYVLVATRSLDASAARDPSYPGSPVVGEFTHPPAQPLVFRVRRDVTEVRFMVVALGSDGAIVGRSNIEVVRLRP